VGQLEVPSSKYPYNMETGHAWADLGLRLITAWVEPNDIAHKVHRRQSAVGIKLPVRSLAPISPSIITRYLFSLMRLAAPLSDTGRSIVPVRPFAWIWNERFLSLHFDM